ncbi:hypothetical protein GGR51DRAFT_390262 [Nemania sp. FL0031]|nr:hypothetical protein GGR51DRAFT_390262 [Nemania sp. FL0031]
MNSTQSRPARNAGNGASGGWLKEKIDDLIAKFNDQEPFPPHTDQKQRSELLREHFVDGIWPQLCDDYDTMIKDLKGLLQNQFGTAIPSDVSGRAKTAGSVKASLQRRETALHAEEGHYFTNLEDIFQAMHDLAGLRIVLKDRDDLGKGQELIKRLFQMKASVHFHPDREVGKHCKRTRFGAYQTDNYRLILRDDETGPISQYADVMFEVQLTTFSDDLYNIIAHALLYKSTAGPLTPQEEMVLDLSHGLGQCFELCLKIFKDKLNASSSGNLPGIKGNEDEFAEMDKTLGPGTSNEARVALDEIIGNFNAGEFDAGVKSMSERVDQILNKEMKRRRRSKVLQDLSILPYRDRKDRNPTPVQGTCHWFINHELFRQWRDNKSSSLLWVSADPGCGRFRRPEGRRGCLTLTSTSTVRPKRKPPFRCNTTEVRGR